MLGRTRTTGMKRLAWVLGTGALALAGLGVWWFWGRPAPPAAVKAVTVKPGVLTEAVYASGTVVPNRRQEVRALSPGKVAKVAVKAGDTVKAGQVLVQMDTTLADAQVAQAQANLEAARAGQAVAQKNLSQAQERLAVLKANSQAGNVAVANAPGVGARIYASESSGIPSFAPPTTFSPPGVALNADGAGAGAPGAGVTGADAVSQLEGSVNQLQGSVQQAGSTVKQAQAALNMAQTQRDQLSFKADFAGTVLEVNAEEGNPVPLQSPLVVVADLRNLSVQVDLNEVDAGKVRSGQKVSVSSKVLSQDVQGEVKTVSPQAVVQPSLQGNAAHTVGVTVSLGQVPEALKPGYSVNIKILVASKSGVLAVPQEALFQQGDQIFVYTVVGGKLKKTEVKTGIADDLNQEVTSGLKEGDQVVLSPSSDFYDGMPVTVTGSGGR